MTRTGFVAVFSLAAFLFTGCASVGGSSGGGPNWVCVIVCGLVGAGAGAVATNSNHGDDEEEQARGGAAVGAVVGGVIGHYVCGARKNELPTARATAEPSSGTPPLKVALRGAGQDPDGSIVSYAWDLGDGGTSSEQHPVHTYAAPGRYTPTLTVTDNDGATASASAQVTVAEAAAKAVEPARRIVLRGIGFDFDSARIKPEFEPVLDVAVQELRDSPDVRVEVAGHTDSTGDEAYNQGLSERRAASVVEYLVGKGIDRSRLEAAGYGESQPVADNANRDGRAQNRRVELKVK